MRVLIRWSVESATTVDSYAGHLKGRMDVIWRILQSVMRNPAAWFDLGRLIEDELNHQHASDGRADWSLNGPLVSRNAAAAEVIGLLFHELVINSLEHGALGSDKGANCKCRGGTSRKSTAARRCCSAQKGGSATTHDL